MSDQYQTVHSKPFRQSGEVAGLLRMFDWTESPIGEPIHWPARLRDSVDLALSSAHPMVVFWGPRFICFYNDAFRQSLGPEKHPSALGKPLRKAFAESLPKLEPDLVSVLAGEGAIWRENHTIPIQRHGLLADATWTYSMTPLEGGGGSIAGVLFACQETTGAVRRAAAMEAEDLALRTALESGRIGHWTLDLRNFVLECSTSCKINFGRSPHLGFSYDELKASVHPEDQERMQAAVNRAIERGEDYDIEYRVLRPDGREAWLLIRGRTTYAGDNSPLSMTGISMDVTGRKHAEEHLRLMVDELNHRVKNTLATVQSISYQTVRGAGVPSQVRESLDSRLMALSGAHDILTGESWSGADLAPIVKRACEPFGGPPRIDWSGPSVRLTPRMAVSLALALHELGTNAAKYGALSTAEGRIRIDWQFQDPGDQPELQICWRESGGPPVSPPTRRGFGSRLIQKSLASELGGRVDVDFAPEGVICVLRVRLAQAVLKARGTKFIVARDGESWTVSDSVEVLQWFETQADAISYLTEQLNALRVRGRSGTVLFETTGASDPPTRRRKPRF